MEIDGNIILIINNNTLKTRNKCLQIMKHIGSKKLATFSILILYIFIRFKIQLTKEYFEIFISIRSGTRYKQVVV